MSTIHAQDISKSFPVAIVISRFNENITKALYDGARERLTELAFKDDDITVIWVPGAIEIPLVAQELARKNKYAAIICLGAVIRGETSHYDYVCQQASTGCQQVALENSLPVIFGVLTTDNERQAKERCGGKHGHKGRDAVDAAFEMVSILAQINKDV